MKRPETLQDLVEGAGDEARDRILDALQRRIARLGGEPANKFA